MVNVLSGDRSRASIQKRVAAWLLAVVVVALATGCATTDVPPPVERLSERQGALLLSPLSGYPLAAAGDLAERVEQGYLDLISARDPQQVAALAEEVLASDPGFHPATVLRAQVDLVEGRPADAEARLVPLSSELPDYLAAELARGRAAEELGDAVTAYTVFRRFSLRNGAASRRARGLEVSAIDTVETRLVESLDRGHFERAEEHLAQLQRWLGSIDPRVLDGRRRLAVAGEDSETELEVLRRMAEGGDLEHDLEVRLGALEVDHGDVRRGLEIFEAIQTRLPDDPEVADQLDRAKFVWRLELLPESVQQLARKGELLRSDFAVLVYWLMPAVRTAPATVPTIANDILDHPERNAIVQVLNQGLMPIDETVHRFEPNRRVQRSTALVAFLTLLERSPQRLSCLADTQVAVLRRSSGLLCETADRCQLLGEAAECLPAAPLSGAEALEWVRKTLDLQGAATRGSAPG